MSLAGRVAGGRHLGCGLHWGSVKVSDTVNMRHSVRVGSGPGADWKGVYRVVSTVVVENVRFGEAMLISTIRNAVCACAE